MQRWHLTLGLAALAIGAVFLAPRLFAATGAIAVAPPTPVPPGPPPGSTDVPPPVAVAAPTDTGHLIVEAGLDRTAVMKGHDEERFVAITITGPEEGGTSLRRSVDVGVVMDISGSMTADDKIGSARAAAKDLARGLQGNDRYSLTVFNDDALVAIPVTAITDIRRIENQIDDIYQGGGTNLYAGLVKGAKEVESAIDGENIGRVILLSDGKANVGIVDPDRIGAYCAELQSHGITVSTVGLGHEFNAPLLTKLADMGGGEYHYVESGQDLKGVFDEELRRSTTVVARGTSVDISLGEGVEPIEVIGWSATPTGNGWVVNAGDITAGETKRIVVKVRVHGNALGDMPVANVTTTYTDLIDNVAGIQHDPVSAEVTADVARVERSLDKPKAKIAVQAYGNAYLDRSAAAYESGNIAEAQRLAGEGAVYLDDNVDLMPELKGDADNLKAQQQNYEIPETSARGRQIALENRTQAYKASH